MEGVRSYELTHGAGGIPVLKLDINALKFSVNTEARVYDMNSLQEMDIVWKHDILDKQ